MVSADVLVQDGTIDALLHHFGDPSVGIVGGQPLPVNDEATLLGHTVHLLWRLHDRLARDVPKLGEVVAFRNVVPRTPLDSAGCVVLGNAVSEKGDRAQEGAFCRSSAPT